MSRIGLRAITTFEHMTGLLPVPALSSIAAVQITFEHASGTIGTLRGFKKVFPSAYEYLQATLAPSKHTALHTLLRKLCRLGPVSSVPSCGIPDVALEDINVDKENVAELDNYLLDTLHLRTTPFTSLLLPGVANTDFKVYKKCLHLLERTTCQNAPTIVSLVAQEIQAGAVPTSSSPSFPQQLSTHAFQPAVSLTRRRDASDLVLDSFSSINTRISQNDYTLLAHNVVEDPDFPVAPFWHVGYATQRSWLDTAIQLPEDCLAGFFVHEVLLKKVLQQLNSTGGFPHPGKFRLLRSSAAAETQKLMNAEVAAAMNGESNRLLRCRIEHLISQVAYTEEQHKALRLMPLNKFHEVDAMQLSESSITMSMTAQMQQIIDEDGITDINQACICDIISDYSADIDEHYWNDDLVLDVICNHRKRKVIQDWILSLEASIIVHHELYNDDENYCGPLEPVQLTDDQMSRADLPIPSTYDVHQFPVIEFQRDKDGNVLLPLDDGYPPERSSGFYTNLSGLTDVPSVSSNLPSGGGSSSIKDEDSPDRADSTCSAELLKSPKDFSVYGASSKICEKEKYDPTLKAEISTQDGCTLLSTMIPLRSRKISLELYEYDKKRFAMNSATAHNFRRLNSLRMGWDIPHRSHGPQQPGLRPRKMIYENRYWCRPSLDWDLAGAAKPHFAQENSERGPLTLLNEQVDAIEAAINGTPLYFPPDQDVFEPPRRPPHDELPIIFWEYEQNFSLPYKMKPLQKQCSNYEAGTRGVDGGVLIHSQEEQAWSAIPMDDPFV